MSNEDQNLEQGSAASAGEPVMSEEKAVAKFSALRKRAQEAEIREAELKGRLEEVTKANTKLAPPTKAPLDIEIERQTAAGIDAADMTVSPTVVRAQSQYDAQVARKAASTLAANNLKAAQGESIAEAKLVHEDWGEVVKAGQGLLSEAALNKLNKAGDRFGISAYEICQAAVEDKAAADAARALKAKKPDDDLNIAPETKPSKSGAPAKKHVPTQDEIISAVGHVDAITQAAVDL